MPWPQYAVRSTLVVALLGALAAGAHAAERDRDEPIRINARSVEANEKTGSMVYRGDVHAVQGGLSIRADRVEIQTRRGKTEVIRATGKPVVLRRRADEQNEELQAEAERVDYHVARRVIDMSGNVKLTRGPDVFTAHVLNYNLDTKLLNAAGRDGDDGRIHAVIHPAHDPDAPARP